MQLDFYNSIIKFSQNFAVDHSNDQQWLFQISSYSKYNYAIVLIILNIINNDIVCTNMLILLGQLNGRKKNLIIPLK